MDLASLSNDLEVVVGISLIVSTGLIAWKLITSFASSAFLGSEVYAMEGASSVPAQGTQPQPTSAQEVPEEDEETEEDAEPRGTCNPGDLQALNASVRCTSANGQHKSPLQPIGNKCVCTRCGEGILHGQVS